MIGLGIFLIYCYRKKQQETTYAPQSGWNSGRSMSSSRGVELMGYGNQNSRGSGYNNQGFNNNNGGFNNSGYGTMNSTDRHRQQQRQAFLWKWWYSSIYLLLSNHKNNSIIKYSINQSKPTSFFLFSFPRFSLSLLLFFSTTSWAHLIQFSQL